MTSSSSDGSPGDIQPLDLAVLKSWDFGDWRERFGYGTELPYRMDYLERHGFRLHWTDALHGAAFQNSRTGDLLHRAESSLVPFAQTLLMRRRILSSPVTLAMFESEANFLAVARQARLAPRRSTFVVLTCWLAHILTSSGTRRLSTYRWAYRSVDRLYYLSANQGPILQDLLCLPADRLRYVPFGVDTVGFSPTEEPDAEYVLAVGRDSGRDWPTLLEAVEGTDLPVKVCCRPADLAGLRIPDNVEVLGYVGRDVYRRLLSRARVVAVAAKPVVYPSGQSVMLEAMAMARTVVVTGTEAMQGYVEDGINSLVVPPADPSALRAAIRAAASDDALRRRIGRGARRSAVESFDAATMWATIAGDIGRLVSNTTFAWPSSGQ